MSININTVYQTVQAVLNKEQRGYVSPADFNKFAEQAQLEIFESYFYDKSHFSTSRKGADGMQSMNLTEKLDLFMVYDSTDLTLDSKNRFTFDDLTPSLYRLCQVYYNDTTGKRIVDKINHKGSQYVMNSSKTRGSVTFPKYRRYGDALEINPGMPTTSEEFIINQDFIDNSSDSFTLDRDDVTGLISIESFRNYEPGSNVPTDKTLEPKTFTGVLANNVVTVASPSRQFAVGDVITITYVYEANITIDYFKRPSTPIWGYVGGNTPIYNPSATASTDFELHPSDQYVLVLKILELAGVEVKSLEVVQFATNEIQQDNTNKKS